MGRRQSNPLGTDQLGRWSLIALDLRRADLTWLRRVDFRRLTCDRIVRRNTPALSWWLGRQLLMRLCDGVMAFPSLILVLVSSCIFGPGLKQVIIALMLVQWSTTRESVSAEWS